MSALFWALGDARLNQTVPGLPLIELAIEWVTDTISIKIQNAEKFSRTLPSLNATKTLWRGEWISQGPARKTRTQVFSTEGDEGRELITARGRVEMPSRER